MCIYILQEMVTICDLINDYNAQFLTMHNETLQGTDVRLWAIGFKSSQIDEFM